MAGDWIKIEIATLDKPEVLGMARALGVPKATVLGALVELFAWYNTHLENGNAHGVTVDMIDGILRNGGVTACNATLSDALKKVGWLIDIDGALSIPNFERHNGKTAKSRALTAMRVSNFRKRRCNDLVTSREEKSIGITSNTNTRAKPAPVVTPDWIPEDAWIGYREMRVKTKKAMTSHAEKLAYKKLEELKAAGNDPQLVLEQSILNGWAGLYEIRRAPGHPKHPQPGGAAGDGKITCETCGIRTRAFTGRQCNDCWRKGAA